MMSPRKRFGSWPMRIHWSVAGWLWPLVVGGCEPSPRACLASEDIVPLSELGWFVPKEGEPVLLLTEGEMFVVALTGRADVRATATLETIADRQSLPQTNATPLPQGVRAEFRLTTSSTSMATIRVNDGTREGCWPARITEPVDRERIDAETERPPLAEILRLRAVARSLTRKGKGGRINKSSPGVGASRREAWLSEPGGRGLCLGSILPLASSSLERCEARSKFSQGYRGLGPLARRRDESTDRRKRYCRR